MMGTLSSFLLFVVAPGFWSSSTLDKPSVVGGWVVSTPPQDGESPVIAFFRDDFLRLRPDGTFVIYRIKFKGSWGWVGDDLVLVPKTFAGQSIDGFAAIAETVVEEVGEEQEQREDDEQEEVVCLFVS